MRYRKQPYKDRPECKTDECSQRIMHSLTEGNLDVCYDCNEANKKAKAKFKRDFNKITDKAERDRLRKEFWIRWPRTESRNGI